MFYRTSQHLFIFIATITLFITSCHDVTRTVVHKTLEGDHIITVAGRVIHKTDQAVSKLKTIRGTDSQEIAVTWNESGQTKFTVINQEHQWQPAKVVNYQLRLRSGAVDPLSNESLGLSSQRQTNIYLVQFHTQIIEAYRTSLKTAGAKILKYMHNNAYMIEYSGNAAKDLGKLEMVRWVGPVLPSFKVSSEIVYSLTDSANNAKNYAVVPTTADLRMQMAAKLETIGATLIQNNTDGYLIEAKMTSAQVALAANLDEVLWIDLDSAPEDDMDNVRNQGGANYLKTRARVPEGFTGIGIKGHVMEGIYPDHQDFAENDFRTVPIAVDNSDPASHGHATFGIVFGSGAGKAEATGMMPNAQGYFTNYRAIYNGNASSTTRGTRYELVGRLMAEHNIIFQTASWGYSRTRTYGSRSAEMDKIIFDHDIPITQSQSNSGNQDSRPQAWAKNIISVGAVKHYDTLSTSDDKWNAGGSTGPAKDGRIKPDLCAYYDLTMTTAPTGYKNFGGTSGATPIVAGHLGLFLEMWTDGIFDNELPAPIEDRFANRPHFTTSKAVLINTARQYSFSGESHDLTRVHQGWGFPSLDKIYDLRDSLFVINETVIIKNLETKSWEFIVAENEKHFQATMVFAEPEANLQSAYQTFNDLNLRVTSPAGKIYWGNNGLRSGNYSVEDGNPDARDTVENVIINNPVSGKWTVEVIAADINTDTHVETEQVDADFALVVSGGQ